MHRSVAIAFVISATIAASVSAQESDLTSQDGTIVARSINGVCVSSGNAAIPHGKPHYSQCCPETDPVAPSAMSPLTWGCPCRFCRKGRVMSTRKRKADREEIIVLMVWPVMIRA